MHIHLIPQMLDQIRLHFNGEMYISHLLHILVYGWICVWFFFYKRMSSKVYKIIHFTIEVLNG